MSMKQNHERTWKEIITMANEILKDEILKDEQLNDVSGGAINDRRSLTGRWWT